METLDTGNIMPQATPALQRAGQVAAALVSGRWWWVTILVLAAMGVMVRLGFWQLDRLAQRRAANALVTSRLAAPPLVITGAQSDLDPEALYYRTAIVKGEYDHSQQVVLINQFYQGQPGVHLVTPLVIEGSSQAVLVDRGWIAYEAAQTEQWENFAELGIVEITGMMLLSETLPNAETSVTAPQDEWFRVDVEGIQAQVTYELLPLYIRQAPSGEQTASLLQRSLPEIELTEGPHLGYAIQWYLFAVVLGAGYVRYIAKNTAPKENA